MIIIDNFDKIIKLLDFPDDNTFYFLQIIQRKKDNPEIGRNSNVIKCYYISSKEYLYKKREEIIKLCDIFNARASINLNNRDWDKVHVRMIVKLANQLNNKDHFGPKTAFESVCGEVSDADDKRWVIDIDTKDVDVIFDVKNFICKLHNDMDKNYKILETIQTLNGYHVISNPFPVDKFREGFPEIEVHKNNPTLLYYNKPI